MNMGKANIRNTKTKCEIRSNTTSSRKSVVNLEQIFVSTVTSHTNCFISSIVWVFKTHCFSNDILSVFAI